MKFSFLRVAIATLMTVFPVFAEQNSELIEVAPDKFLRWFGHQGRTYFVQASDPNDHLKTWIWCPIIETGNDENISYEVDGTADKGFFQLWFTDEVTTDPDGDDFDNDFLSNLDEVTLYQTNPLDDDSDDDGIWDDYEVLGEYGYVTDPNSADTDGDGLTDEEEIFDYSTDPTDGDTDGDGLLDGEEVNVYLSDPNVVNSAADSDGDGLPDVTEFALGLNPAVVDSDGNGINDGLEDRDLDGLSNLDEFLVYFTRADQPDTDMDTMADGWEVMFGFNATIHNGNTPTPADDANADPDNDGLTNAEESALATNPNNPDTDGDGVDDNTENNQGSNPNDPNDSQPPPSGTVPVNVTFGDPSRSNSEKYQVKLVPLEGDTSGHSERFRTNRAYGEPQTDTFHLPKGAKYEVTLIHISSDPEYEDTPKPDYDYELEIETSQGCLVVDDPNGLMGGDNGNATFTAAGKVATLYVPLFLPKEVSFSGSTVGNLIRDDASVTYDAPHWQDGNDDGDADDTGERKYPISYVRDTPPTIAGKIKVKPSGLTSVSGFSAKIRVMGPGNIEVDETTATIGTDELELLATASAGKFENEIDYLNPMALSWEVEVNDEGHWCEAGDTSHRAYVTLGAPATTMRQETLFDIGCRNADGETDGDAAFDKVWNEFSDRFVSRVDPITGDPTRDSMGMVYWLPGGNGCVTVSQFLDDGDASCGTWAEFQTEVMKAIGVNTAVVSTVDAPLPANYSGSVTAYKAYANFSGNVYWYSYNGANGNNVPASLNAGDRILYFQSNNGVNGGIFFVKQLNLGNSPIIAIPANNAGFPNSSSEAQGNINARAWFGNHAIVKYNNKYYDPSYGGASKASGTEWEDNALQYFGGLFTVAESNGLGGVTALETLLWNERADPKGAQETNIAP